MIYLFLNSRYLWLRISTIHKTSIPWFGGNSVPLTKNFRRKKSSIVIKLLIINFEYLFNSDIASQNYLFNSAIASKNFLFIEYLIVQVRTIFTFLSVLGLRC